VAGEFLIKSLDRPDFLMKISAAAAFDLGF
jgi:hypothetical protein